MHAFKLEQNKDKSPTFVLLARVYFCNSSSQILHLYSKATAILVCEMKICKLLQLSPLLYPALPYTHGANAKPIVEQVLLNCDWGADSSEDNSPMPWHRWAGHAEVLGCSLPRCSCLLGLWGPTKPPWAAYTGQVAPRAPLSWVPGMRSGVEGRWPKVGQVPQRGPIHEHRMPAAPRGTALLTHNAQERSWDSYLQQLGAVTTPVLTLLQHALVGWSSGMGTWLPCPPRVA